jgi:hypothetical protein
MCVFHFIFFPGNLALCGTLIKLRTTERRKSKQKKKVSLIKKEFMCIVVAVKILDFNC